MSVYDRGFAEARPSFAIDAWCAEAPRSAGFNPRRGELLDAHLTATHFSTAAINPKASAGLPACVGCFGRRFPCPS